MSGQAEVTGIVVSIDNTEHFLDQLEQQNVICGCRVGIFHQHAAFFTALFALNTQGTRAEDR